MTTTPFKPPLSVLLLCCTCFNGLAWAEPTTVPRSTDEPAVETATVERDAAPKKGLDIGAAAAVDVPNQSSTIKMLLELQATPEPGASASESGRRAARPGSARTAAQTTAPNPFGSGENPFGGSPGAARAAPSPASQSLAIDWQSGPGGAIGGGLGAGSVSARNPELFPAQQPRGSSRDDVGEQRSWMPMSLIHWVREHRQGVLIGAAVALGLAWAVTSYSQRRRR